MSEHSSLSVLVVDDDPIARMTHLALLAKVPKVKPSGSGSVAEARAAIHQQLPDAALLDMQLPDGTGLELMSLLDEQCDYGQRGPLPLVLVVSAQLEPEHPALPRSARLHKVAKPVQLRQLTQFFGGTPLRPSAALPFAVSDYVQLACAGAYSVYLQCTSSAGEGEIRILNGQLWSARDTQGHGVPAFLRLVAASRVLARPAPEERPPRELPADWTTLLLAAPPRLTAG